MEKVDNGMNVDVEVFAVDEKVTDKKIIECRPEWFKIGLSYNDWHCGMYPDKKRGRLSIRQKKDTGEVLDGLKDNHKDSAKYIDEEILKTI